MITLAEYYEAEGLAQHTPRRILPFHARILGLLQSIVLGSLPGGAKNLCINIPPGHGKTTLVKAFVAYGLGCFPDSQFIYTGYSSDLAEEQTRSIGRTLREPWYQEMFPDVRLTKTAADHFTTSDRGLVYGPGAGGTITGFRAGCKRPEFGGAIVVDDPLKAQDARSDVMLKSGISWYTGTLKSRANWDRTPIVLIMQRLNPDDLAGFVLKNEPGDWCLVKIPGLLPDGTALWPETKSARSMERLREVDEFTFWSQYQQEPQAPGGNMIKRAWWKYYDAAHYNQDGLIFITADTAVKDKDTSDYSCAVVWNASQNHLDAIDHIRGKWNYSDLKRRIKALYDKWRPAGCKFVYVEDAATGTPVCVDLGEMGLPMMPWLPGDYSFPVDKIGRVRMSLWYIEAGRVRLPNDNPEWVEPFLEECSAFSGAKSDTDDQVDVATMAVSIWKWKGGGADIAAA